MKTAVVPSSWLGITGNWSAYSMVKLAERVQATGTDPNDLPKVLDVAHAADDETVAKVKAIRGELRGVEARRKALLDELKPLEPIMYTPGWRKMKHGRDDNA